MNGIYGNISTNPFFTCLPGNDLPLLAGFPCIDAGTNGAPLLPAVDFDGNPRILAGNTNHSATVDMGAYEFNSTSPPTACLYVNCPSNVVATVYFGQNSAAVTYPAPDATPGATVTCIPASGSVFPVGTNVVVCTLVYGTNTLTCTFTATVQVVTNAPPQVTLQTPQNGAVIQSGGNLQLVATATDANDSIAFVTFLSSTNVLGVVINAPYSLFWSNVPAGHYGLQAIAQNSFGSRGTSAVANVTVSLVQNGGFETGAFTGWTLVGRTNGSGGIYNGVESSYSVTHSGTFGALLGDIQVATLSQALSTVPGQYYLLSLWLDNVTSGTQQLFSVSWNTNSAATNTLFSITNPPAFSWTNLQFLVVATGTNTSLLIRAENDPNCFGLDDISVTPIPLPTFQTSAVSANGFELSWLTAPGLAYQVQYKTNLLQTSWVNLTTSFMATNYSSTLVDTNAVSSSRQRFYRLILSP